LFGVDFIYFNIWKIASKFFETVFVCG
jgi:hypothetical protein